MSDQGGILGSVSAAGLHRKETKDNSYIPPGSILNCGRRLGRNERREAVVVIEMFVGLWQPLQKWHVGHRYRIRGLWGGRYHLGLRSYGGWQMLGAAAVLPLLYGHSQWPAEMVLGQICPACEG